MKSVHITNYYHKNSGGISTAYNRLLEAANRRKRHVRLIVPGEKDETEEVGEYGRIHYVKADFSPLFDKRYRVMLPWKTYIFDDAPIKRILREEKPDLVEIGEKYSLSLIAGLLRKGVMNVASKRPLLVHFSCERMDDNVRSFISKGSLAKWLSRLFMGNYVIPMFDFHLTNSEFTAEEVFEAASPSLTSGVSNRFKSFCWRILRSPKIPIDERVFVNHCGVDSECFSISRQGRAARQTIMRRYNLRDDAKLLLYAGRISPEKNVVLLPAMMKILGAAAEGPFHLLIAGDGPSAGRIVNEFAKDEATLVGHLTDKNELADLFANCDVFVHPNPREPFGITPLEAMASGLPVIAPNSGGVVSYANGENAWLVEPDAQSFAGAVLAVFSDETRRRSRVKCGLATANAYTWETSTDALFTLYDKMCAEFTSKRDLFDYKKSDLDVASP